MSRFLPKNHPQRGVCTLCRKSRLLVADFGIDAMLVTHGTSQDSKGRDHVSIDGSFNLAFKHPFCRHCYRLIRGYWGAPAVHLASRGFTKRLTRKQTVVAARKLARDLKKMQDES